VSFIKPSVKFTPPAEVRRSFMADNTGIAEKRTPHPNWQKRRPWKTNHWPREMLGYSFLERCKEVVCTVKHPTGWHKRRWNSEYRVSIMPWSRGSYLDIRLYKLGGPTNIGILLHLDIMSAILPEIIAAVRRMENEDTREPDKKAEIVVERGPVGSTTEGPENV